MTHWKNSFKVDQLIDVEYWFDATWRDDIVNSDIDRDKTYLYHEIHV